MLDKTSGARSPPLRRRGTTGLLSSECVRLDVPLNGDGLCDPLSLSDKEDQSSVHVCPDEDDDED